MSGQLVGEVLDHAEWLRAQGLKPRAYQALIGIADRCLHETRQGAVPYSRIQAAMFGASRSTAERAVAELLKAGVVSVVQKGFNNQNGHSQARIYRVEQLGVPVITVRGTPADHAATVPVTTVKGTRGERPPQIEGASPSNQGSVPVTQGDAITEFLNGTDNGTTGREAPAETDLDRRRRWRKENAAPTLAEWERDHTGEAPPRICPGHRHLHPSDIPACTECGGWRVLRDDDYARAHPVRSAPTADEKAMGWMDI